MNTTREVRRASLDEVIARQRADRAKTTYIPECLRDLPSVRRERKQSAKALREQSAAIIGALQDVSHEIRAKLLDNPEWQRGYHSALAVVEARMTLERAK